MNFNDCVKELDDIHERLVEEFDPRIKHFDIGDKAWMIQPDIDPFFPVEVVIVDVTQTHKDGYYFYWFRNADLSKFDIFLAHLKWKIWYISPTFIKKIWDKLFGYRGLTHGFGPGHGVLAGRGEALFKDKSECMIDYEIDQALYRLGNVEYLTDPNTKLFT